VSNDKITERDKPSQLGKEK